MDRSLDELRLVQHQYQVLYFVWTTWNWALCYAFIDDDDPLFHRMPSANGSCMFRNNEPHVVSFYNDLEIREDIVEFPPGTTIISR